MPADYRIARGCSPPESDLTPEGAIRRGRGTVDAELLVDQWAEEVDHLREVVNEKDKFLEQMSGAYTIQTKLKEAAEQRLALAEKVIEAAKEARNHHWKLYDCGKAVQCPLCAAIQEYYSVGFILYGPGGE